MVLIFKNNIQVGTIVDFGYKFGIAYGTCTGGHGDNIVAPWEWHMLYLSPLNDEKFTDFELRFVP